jgi:hypothetical protein
VEPDPVEIARGFTRELGKLHQQAGRPSYSTLERLSKHYLRRATVSDVLNGNRVRVPDWSFVSAFVTACHAAAEESRLDPAGLGSIAEWKTRWDAATVTPPVALTSLTADAPAVAGQVAQPGSPHEAPGIRAEPLVTGGLPPRLASFVGREDAIEDVRRELIRDNRTSAVAIQGLCGIGKTQLAVEYAYRYADSYDLIWWVPSDDHDSAFDALAELQSRLELASAQPGTRTPESLGSLFESLRREQPRRRWLLIFDNANDPDEIKDLLPSANGHTLITTRNARWDASDHRHELDLLARAESVGFLRRRLRWLSEADAQRLAEAVGDLPLLLEHAAEAGLPVADYVARLDHEPLDLLDARPAGYPVSVASAWTEVLRPLRGDAEDAWDLLCCLSFFGTESISRGYLDDARRVPGISVHELLSDPLRLNLAIRALGARGLLRVQRGTGTLQVQRITQYVVRYLVANDDGQ